MATIRCNGNWVQFNSHENQCFQQDEEEEQDQEEETLSLCDLPTNDQETAETTSKQHDNNDPEDFEFGSCHNNTTFSTENMCNADEVFFQGQILPLRHSISTSVTSDTTSLTRKINRSNSAVDPRTIRVNGYNKYKPRVRNQFHSHPSPSPQIRTQSFRALSHSNPKNASLWSFLQVGLVKPQEIGLSDLKNRSKRFGSHNSNSSSNSSGMNSTTDQNQNQNKVEKARKNMKKKQRLFFVGGCKCSVDSVERTIKETVPKKKTTKDESLLHLKNVEEVSKESKMIGDNGKQAVSRHRTFEWLKQLSIAAPTEA